MLSNVHVAVMLLALVVLCCVCYVLEIQCVSLLPISTNVIEFRSLNFRDFTVVSFFFKENGGDFKLPIMGEVKVASSFELCHYTNEHVTPFLK